MARGILLDTSIWICYLRPRGWDDLKTAVQQVLTVEPVYTCWVVMAELLIGARDERGFTQLFETLRALPEIPVTDRVWEAAARLGYTLRRQGVTIPLPDLVIAQAAITGDLTLWHVDDHFEHLRRHSPLQTRSVVPEACG
jgi:predicted nucleic acid-binding protein